jgi:hypothetical protein
MKAGLAALIGDKTSVIDVAKIMFYQESIMEEMTASEN